MWRIVALLSYLETVLLLGLYSNKRLADFEDRIKISVSIVGGLLKTLGNVIYEGFNRLILRA